MTPLLHPLDTAPAPLATAMREGSMAEHQSAEGSTFMTELLAGRLHATGYADYLLRLRMIYAALESAVRVRQSDPVVAAVHDPALERLTAIDADLAHWAPGRDRQIDSPAASAYAARLEAAGAGWSGLLVAHHYTRYLGDLSGGRAIGKTLDRTFALRGTGLDFYRFAEIPKPKPYKDAYRARLDALGLGADEIDQVVGEVKVAFGLNQAFLTELGHRIDEYRH